MQIGDDVVGVRIAIRDIAEGQKHKPESQIYNWGIKKDASLDGTQPAKNDSSRGISSDASNYNISKRQGNVNSMKKEANSQGENASFFMRILKSPPPNSNLMKLLRGLITI